MRLLRVELSRFASRRAVVLLLLAGALISAFLAFQIVHDTRPATHQEIQNAKAQAALAADDSQNKAEVTACEKDPTSYLGPGKTREACAAELLPSAKSLLPRQSLDIGRTAQNDGVKVAVLLVGLALIAGATYAGADWGSGSIDNQLLFTPRRFSVWLAKAGAVVLLTGLATAVVLGGFWLTLTMTADHRGAALPDNELAKAGWLYARSVGLAAGAALGGYALTMLFRHTVATLALLFAYAAGGEVLINLVPIHNAARYAVGNNVFGWLQAHHTYYDRSVGCQPFRDCNPIRSLGHLDALWFLLALLVVAVVASVVSFQRRDV